MNDILNIPQAAHVGDYVTGFQYGPSRVIRRFWDGWTWCYELENGAVMEENELTIDNVLLESEVL